MADRRAQRRPFPRRADLPEELHPLFDALMFELQRVADEARWIHRLRQWQLASLGGLVVATIINIVPAIVRAIG